MALRRGFLHWAQFDKRRPALVVSPDERNALGNDVVVVPCTRTRRLGPWHVALPRGEGGLPRASVAKCELVTTLLKEDLDEMPIGGPLRHERMIEIERALLLALGIRPSALEQHLEWFKDQLH